MIFRDFSDYRLQRAINAVATSFLQSEGAASSGTDCMTTKTNSEIKTVFTMLATFIDSPFAVCNSMSYVVICSYYSIPSGKQGNYSCRVETVYEYFFYLFYVNAYMYLMGQKTKKKHYNTMCLTTQSLSNKMSLF